MSEKKKLSLGKKLGIAFGTIGIVIVILSIVGYFLIGDYFYDFAINAKSTIYLEMMTRTDSTPQQSPLRDDAWLDGYDKQETVTLTSTDKRGLKLSAIKLTTRYPSSKWVVTVHGYRGENREMSAYAKAFIEKGYNVLMPSLRGHGESEGDYIGMGWDDRLDLTAWIAKIVEWNPQATVVLHGVSMGAATVLMATGEKLPDNVVAAVSDCSYTSAYDEFVSILEANNVPRFPVMQAAGTMTNLKAGFGLSDASAVRQVKKSTTPTLFIHGDADAYVPYEMMDQLFEACNAAVKARYTAQGAGHALAMTSDPTAYFDRIFVFLSAL